MTGHNATRFAKTGLAAAAAMAVVSGAGAATITWGSITAVTSASDISNAGTAVAADSFGGGAATINGVSFSDSGGYFGSGLWTTPTGNADLDNLLDSHTNSSGAAPFTVTATGLTVGQQYQVQLILLHDLRGCCSGRTYNIGDGTGANSGLTTARGQGGTLIGTFTADSSTQSVSLFGDAGSNPDAGLSGYVFRQVPEPGSLALLGLGGLMLARRRRG